MILNNDLAKKGNGFIIFVINEEWSLMSSCKDLCTCRYGFHMQLKDPSRITKRKIDIPLISYIQK